MYCGRNLLIIRAKIIYAEFCFRRHEVRRVVGVVVVVFVIVVFVVDAAVGQGSAGVHEGDLDHHRLPTETLLSSLRLQVCLTSIAAFKLLAWPCLALPGPAWPYLALPDPAQLCPIQPC